MDSLAVAICDDDTLILPQLSERISTMFQIYGFNADIHTFASGKELFINIYKPTKYDVYFMDIDFPESDGIEMAEKIREIQPNSILIFVSAKEELVFNTFKVQPFFFVRKSNFSKDISNAISGLIKKIKVFSEPIIFISDSLKRTYKFNVNQIIYIEGSDKYINIITTNGNRLIRYLMSDIEHDLEPYNFIRIHKSYLVNYKFIQKIKQNKVILDSGLTLPISRYRLEEVERLFCLYTS